MSLGFIHQAAGNGLFVIVRFVCLHAVARGATPLTAFVVFFFFKLAIEQKRPDTREMWRMTRRRKKGQIQTLYISTQPH